MNNLEQWLQENGFDLYDALNQLQDAGIISDECSSVEDVGKADIPRAIEFLKKYHLTNP